MVGEYVNGGAGIDTSYIEKIFERSVGDVKRTRESFSLLRGSHASSWFASIIGTKKNQGSQK